MELKTVSITPELAKEWLDKSNYGNRNIDKERVRVYAYAMKKGNWLLTPEAIAFTHDGRLLNGQHRLLAVVEADIPVSFSVIIGASEDSFSVIDTGKNRTVGQILGMAGVKNSVKANVISSNALRYLTDRKALWSARNPRIERLDVLNFAVDNDQLIQEMIPHGDRLRRIINFKQSPISTAFFLIGFLSQHAENLDSYLDSLESLKNLEYGILAIRNRKNTYTSKAKLAKNSYFNSQAEISMLLKSWRVFNLGIEMKKANFHESELKTSGMPEVY